MNKRITSLMLVFTLILTMLATAVPALAAPPASSCTYSIEADKTSANPGDTINFTIYMQQTGNQNTLEGTLVIPDGLTFVTGSGKLEDGIKTTLGWDSVEWTPVPNMILNGFGSESFTGTDKLALMKFQCTVDNDATAKDYEVTLIELVADDENYETKNPTCIPATVTVTAAPVSVTGVTIDETLSVNIGQTKTPSFTVAPAEATNKTVLFTSSDTSVATVNATTGAVTGVKKGTATITVKTADGNFIDTCTVRVSCTHTNKSTVPAQDSTCTVKGWDEYKKCDDCGQLFDKDGNAISAIPYLPLADHTPVQTATAEYLKSAATCTSPAVYYEHCSVCDVKLSTTFTSGSTVPHTESGWKSDANGHWKECTVCGTITTTKVAHTPDHEGHATEEYSIKCTECDYVIEAQLSHTHSYGSDWKSNADKHWHECSCGDKAEEATHTASDWITDTAATATTDGTKHKECTVCHRVLETGTIPAAGGGEHMHNYSSDWKSDSINHWKECSCGHKDDVAAHSFKWVVDKEATVTKKGTKHEECKVCGYQRPAVEIPATGSTAKPNNPTENNPKTGDNSMMGLWIALLFVSGVGVVGTTIYSRKKKYTVK